MTDTVPQAAAAVSSDVAKVEAQVSFVRANWTKLSIAVIVVFALGVFVGHLI